MNCINNGKPTADCKGCGCQAGFAGKHCQCNGRDGVITLDVVKDLLLRTDGKLSASSDDGTTANASTNNNKQKRFLMDNNTRYHSPITPQSTPDDKALYDLAVAIFDQVVEPLTGSKSGSLAFTMTSSTFTYTDESIGHRTDFTFKIPYACIEHNTQLKNVGMVEAAWERFVGGFTQLPIIKTEFVPTKPGHEQQDPGMTGPVAFPQPLVLMTSTINDDDGDETAGSTSGSVGLGGWWGKMVIGGGSSGDWFGFVLALVLMIMVVS